jgi:hypothetical protein
MKKMFSVPSTNRFTGRKSETGSCFIPDL